MLYTTNDKRKDPYLKHLEDLETRNEEEYNRIKEYWLALKSGTLTDEDRHPKDLRKREEVHKIRTEATANSNFWDVAFALRYGDSEPDETEKRIEPDFDDISAAWSLPVEPDPKRPWRGFLPIPSRKKELSRDHPIVRAVGSERAKRLQSVFSGRTLELPTDAAIKRALRDRLIFEWAAWATPEMIVHMLKEGGYEISVSRVKEILRDSRRRDEG